MPSGDSLKAKIKEGIASGLFDTVADDIRLLWRMEPGLSTAAWIKRTVSPRLDDFAIHKTKVAIVRSITCEPCVDCLVAASLGERLRVTPWLGGVATFHEELLDPNRTTLSNLQPDLTIVAIDSRTLVPDLWGTSFGKNREPVSTVVERASETLASLVAGARQRVSGPIVFHCLELPQTSPLGIAGFCSPEDPVAAIHEINRHLRSVTQSFPDVFLCDLNQLIARVGASAWFNDERWRSSLLPWHMAAIVEIADIWRRFVGAVATPIRKVLVVDLDNTLWGGVLGEDGPDGICVSETGQGRVFWEIQKALIELKQRGILLAICSKNDPEPVSKLFASHTGMLVKEKDFVASRINWNSKADNLIELSSELNLGIESFAFLDDNPRERELIRCSLPKVRVLPVTDDPSSILEAIKQEVGFERIRITSSDRQRVEQYEVKRQRENLKARTVNFLDYLHSLQTKVSQVTVDRVVLERVYELSRRTNQFNLTGAQPTLAELEIGISRGDNAVFAYEVEDRFGQEGIVGAVVLRLRSKVVEIEGFWLSCRALGRGVETAMLADLCRQAEKLKGIKLVGRYLRTEKNSICGNFFSDHGFLNNGGETEWQLLLTNSNSIELPGWVEFKESANDV